MYSALCTVGISEYCYNVGVEEERKGIAFGERKARYSDTSSLATLASGDPRVQELQMQVESLLAKYHNQTQVVTVMNVLLDD